MPPKHFVEIGRVALIHNGDGAGKIVTIVDIVDQNRALIDGPVTGVPRQAIQFKNLRLTKFRIRIPHGTGSKTIAKAWEKAEINKLWAETNMSKRLNSLQLKANLTDFDRFKLYKTKQTMNRLIDRKFSVLKAKAKKSKPKPAKMEKKDKKPKKAAAPKKAEKKK